MIDAEVVAEIARICNAANPRASGGASFAPKGWRAVQPGDQIAAAARKLDAGDKYKAMTDTGRTISRAPNVANGPSASRRAPFENLTNGGQEIWTTEATIGIAATPCPRCKGNGQELVFMHFHTCEVCHGAKTVSAVDAREETLDRRFERNKYK